MSAAASPLIVTGTYTLRGDVSVGRIAVDHSFSFSSVDVTDTAVDPYDAAAQAVQPDGKLQRTTANTFAQKPSDIPPTCARHPELTQLVALIRQAQQESDRFLTQSIKTDEDRLRAAAANESASNTSIAAPPSAAKKKRKQGGGREGDDEEGEEEQDGAADEAKDEEDEQQQKKVKV